MTPVAATAEAREIQAPPSPLREFWHYFRENRGAVVGLYVVIGLIVVAALADVIAPHSPFEQYRDALLQPPVWQEGGTISHIMGTDATGRDILSRIIIHGSRLSLMIGCIAVGLSLSVGITLGLMAAFFRPVTETLVMRLMDVVLAVPSLLLALVVVASGPRPGQRHDRRGDRLHPPLRAPDPGLGHGRAVQGLRHRQPGQRCQPRLMAITVLPNCLPPLIVQATLGFSSAVLDAAALSFLGMGAQPPTPEWGAMLADAREFILRAWWVVTFPGLAILITVLAFNMMGDGLRDALDPKLKRS